MVCIYFTFAKNYQSPIYSKEIGEDKGHQKSVQRLNKTVSLAQNSPVPQKLCVAYPDFCDESDHCTHALPVLNT